MTDESRLAVAALEDKAVDELRTLYEEVFDEVCRSRHKKYLVRRIAWRLQALRVTGEEYCWTCHQKMDPLGLPFEMYNHAGLFRTTELDKPVDTTGEIIDSGDPTLDGPVANAIYMIEKLAESERAEQVFVRHAFRFWMGRNETLNDAPVLQEAYHADKDNGGSMTALLTSLLTSDAFLYRTRSSSDTNGTAAELQHR